VPLLFSPVDQEELADAFEPRPRHAFLMMQLDGNATVADRTMADEVRAALARANFEVVTAGEVRGTGDYLHKIINLIRGCGFSIAIFSDRTPPKTLANIFFEVGLAGMLGKPVQLILNGENPAPSDFVRSEWISYKLGEEPALRSALDESLAQINALAAFYRDIGEVALEAERPDLELAFERFRQGVLIGDDAQSRDGVRSVQDRLIDARNVEGRDDMATHRDRLFKSVSAFLRLLPAP
jgi:hypothetical protein